MHCLPLPESCVADLPDAMNDSLITSSEDCESASCPYHPDLPSGRSVEPGTELSQGHRRQSLSPWGEDLSQGHSSRSIQSHPYPGCGSAGLPSPDREMQDSPNLPIDSKGLGYAIDRALRIPAINAVDRDEERKDSTLILRLVK